MLLTFLKFHTNYFYVNIYILINNKKYTNDKKTFEKLIFIQCWDKLKIIKYNYWKLLSTVVGTYNWWYNS